MREISPQEALIYVMILTSAADSNMTDAEVSRIGSLVRTLPVFRGFEGDEMTRIARECQEALQDDDGLENVLEKQSNHPCRRKPMIRPTHWLLISPPRILPSIRSNCGYFKC